MLARPHILGITAAIVVCWAIAEALPAQEAKDKFPGYYEFFLKTGKLARLNSEVKRDEAIQQGSLKPIAVNQPVMALELPDGFGKVHSTRAYVGKKNLVMITGRAWW